MTALTLAHSPDADDAFMFHALAARKVSSPSVEFRHELRDIESLNRAAVEGRYDVTAISVHAYPHVASKYRMLTVGASVGDGYGPVVVAGRALTESDLQEATVAIPGEWTTAALVLKIHQPLARTKVLPFDSILDAVRRGDADAGVVIHEGQLTFTEMRLHKVVDLGEWWKITTGTPLPLGALAIRREHSNDVAVAAAEAIRDSIAWGLEHRAEAIEGSRRHARGLDDRRLNRFIEMYVNHFTLNLGPRGEQGLEMLYRLASDAGLIPAGVVPDLIGPLP